MKHFHLCMTSILALILLVGCTANPNTSVPITTVSGTKEQLEWEKYFRDFAGAFVLYELKSDRYIRYNPERCSERFLPASTFKIMNSLIGLETGVIRDENHLMKWDGTQHEIPSWNQDHTLKTAMQNSVVWYHQELAHRVGKDRMQSYIDTVGYGNQDISGPIDAFWLNGALRISAEEQVQFLKRLYKDDLPFSQRSMTIVKEILVLEKTHTYQLSGKTGSGLMNGLYIGWFVGYLEEQDHVYFFATNIQSSSSDAKGSTAKEITLRILQEFE